jgi:signal peptidase I
MGWQREWNVKLKTLLLIFAPLAVALLTACLLLFVLITVRTFFESRYIPSTAMEPTLQVKDRIILQKIPLYLHAPFERGQIIVFYPPPAAMGGHDLNPDIMHLLGRLTGLPIFPYEPAFVKRIIGLPGERIQIVHGEGVFVDGMLLPENYVMEPARYALSVLGDIGGRGADGTVTHPYARTAKDPIVVPKDQLFVLGDNRNNSEDSHVWGFLTTDRMIGIAGSRLRQGRTDDLLPPPHYDKQ